MGSLLAPEVELALVFGLLVLVAVLLVLRPKRGDVVALIPVLVFSITGILRPEQAFNGFISNAVVVLISAFVLARGIFSTGMLDRVADWIFRKARTPLASLMGILVLSATVSSFFSDTGTLLIMLPVAHRLCRRFNLSPSKVMMPLAFATMVSGTVTLTSASSNLVISNYAGRAGIGELQFFSLAPVGLAVTLAGLLVLLFLAPRILPDRRGQASGAGDYTTGEYLTEVKVTGSSPFIGKTALKVEAGQGFPPISAVRRGKSLFSPNDQVTLRSGDLLMLKVAPKDIQDLTLAEGLEMADASPAATDLMEVVVPPNSSLVGHSISEARLTKGAQASILGISRHGLPKTEDLSTMKLQVGDVLLIRGSDDALQESLKMLGCLPLEGRGVVVFNRYNTLKALGIFGLVVGLAVSQVLTVAVAFALGALMIILLGVLSVREAYSSIDWPLVVLLGGLLSLGLAMEETGTSVFIAEGVLAAVGGAGAFASVALLLIIAILLTTIMTNAAVAAIMAPIAVTLAELQGVNPFTLLAAVAVGCSLSMLMPYSHQCNLLVRGPGGYSEGDYLRLGLVVLALCVPTAFALIPLVWPP
jgi:di/tricarboxylate transporter